MLTVNHLTASDLVWIATASLHRNYERRNGFRAAEIRETIARLEPAHGLEESTIRTHIHQHCVAAKRPDPGSKRYLHRNSDGSFRLFREGDPFHPDRKLGASVPSRERLPAKYWPLLDWYSSGGPASPALGSAPTTSPIEALYGTAKDYLRAYGGGEAYLRDLRSDWYGREASPAAGTGAELASPGKRRR